MSEKTGDGGIYPKHGGFEKLLSYQVAELLYDITVRFTKRHIEAGSRTRDQMEQAARSGSRNIAEGSVFSATSKKVEMNLTNVARASLTELKKDYASFLRQRKLPLWPIPDAIRQELIDARFRTADEVALRKSWFQRGVVVRVVPHHRTLAVEHASVSRRRYESLAIRRGRGVKSPSARHY